MICMGATNTGYLTLFLVLSSSRKGLPVARLGRKMSHSFAAPLIVHTKQAVLAKNLK